MFDYILNNVYKHGYYLYLFIKQYLAKKFNSTKKGFHFQRLVITDDDIEKYTHQHNLTLSIQMKLEFCLPINLVSDMFEYLHIYTTEDETSLISINYYLSVCM